MSLKLYMDVHVRRAVTHGLRLRGVDVVTAQEDKSAQLSDADLLSRATLLGRVIFTQDDDLLARSLPAIANFATFRRGHLCSSVGHHHRRIGR